MLKKVAVGLFLLAILGCVASVATGSAFAYVLCFAMLVAVILFGLLVLAVNIIWKFLPDDFKRAHEREKKRLSVVIFFCGLLFFFARPVINGICLPEASGFIHLLGNATTFVFAVFFAWGLIKRSKGKIIIAGSVVFILFIAFLSFVNSTALKSSQIEGFSTPDNLKSLGYVDWVPLGKDIEKVGVTQYEAELTFDGISIYTSKVTQEVYLIDMRGNVVHKWAKKIKGGDRWQYAKMCRNGDVLVVAKDQMLIRLDWDSNVKWKKKIRVHHDVRIDENENIYVIAREDGLVFWHLIPVPILSDYIAVLSPDGEIKKKIYIYNLVKKQVLLNGIKIYYCGILKPINLMRIFHHYYKAKMNYKTKTNYFFRNGMPFDIMHTNSIEIMDRDIDGFCRKGDWLISVRQPDLIGVVDIKKEELVWSWGVGELDLQHHPTLLKNGNVLIFDNGTNRGFSRIIELNPLTRKIVWEYKSEPPEKFFSDTRGSCQRLPNGNTLIAESNKGRVFEITNEGRVVWEFYNPEVETEEKKRATIYRMMRITNPERYKLKL